MSLHVCVSNCLVARRWRRRSAAWRDSSTLAVSICSGVPAPSDRAGALRSRRHRSGSSAGNRRKTSVKYAVTSRWCNRCFAPLNIRWRPFALPTSDQRRAARPLSTLSAIGLTVSRRNPDMLSIVTSGRFRLAFACRGGPHIDSDPRLQFQKGSDASERNYWRAFGANEDYLDPRQFLDHPKPFRQLSLCSQFALLRTRED